METHHPPLNFSPIGNAVILLSDWDKYGLSERVCYHFDLIEVLASTERPRIRSSKSKETTDSEGSPTHSCKTGAVCGVSALLECVPREGRLRSDQKKRLRTDLRNFNGAARALREQHLIACHQPTRLPLRIASSSNILFAYETTRVAFCLDASPTLTSTFGFAGRPMDALDTACCPMDRLLPMAREFFSSLIKPIRVQTSSHRDDKSVWYPELAVTVLAVFPSARSGPLTKLLVRDFRVHNVESAELLLTKLEEWAVGDVEMEIASRLSAPTVSGDILASYEAGFMPMYASSLRDLLDAGDVALSTLASAARPVIVVATDGRSVSCDPILDLLADDERVDVPLVVLDLSSPESHHPVSSPAPVVDNSNAREFHLLSYDPVGALFPLHLSDDTEMLHSICKATGGCFFDATLLQEAATTLAGQVQSDSPLFVDHFFAHKRHTVRPNAVQWYTLFSLSPLSPTIHSHLGRLPPPDYIRRRMVKTDVPPKDRLQAFQPFVARSFDRPGATGAANDRSRPASESALGPSKQPHKIQSVRTTFSTYIVNPIRVKSLLWMRVKEGYRVKLYGSSTNDPDKVSIQFYLPLDLGSVLHYELSYTALPGYNHQVGFANVRIEMSGEPNFIQTVKNMKNDFLQGVRIRPVTMAQHASLRLCELFQRIRAEDEVQSRLLPIKWSDQLSTLDTPFVKRLGMLTTLQRRRHFRCDEFDSVLCGKMPYEHDDDFLSEFREIDDGEQELVEAVSDWATQTVLHRRRFVKRTPPANGGLACFCVLELIRCPVAARIFKVSVETVTGTDPADRLSLIVSIKELLRGLKDVEVLPKQIGPFLVGVRPHEFGAMPEGKARLLEGQHNHASWDLVKDPELFPLLMRRRREIGRFFLLHSTNTHALFAKLVRREEDDGDGKPGDLVQYQLAILRDKVIVDFHMESEGGEFFPFRLASGDGNSTFHRMVTTLQKRDQECGRALRCRTNLLKVFDDSRARPAPDSHVACVQRLLPYASVTFVRLRFFHSGSGPANEILRTLTEEMLLACSFSARVAKLLGRSEHGISGLNAGDIFVVKYDKHTMSLLHLASSEQEEVSQDDGRGLSFRELTFFTIGISDLYSRRDDVADDASNDDHISEYLCVTDFTDLLTAAHLRNYATAAYLALMSDMPPPFRFFHLDDFAEALRTLEFVEVSTVILSGEAGGGDQSMQKKLARMIETVLRPIPDEDFCLFYKGGERQDMFLTGLDDESDTVSIFSSPLASESDEESQHAAADLDSIPDDESSSVTNLGSNVGPGSVASAPLFVRFLLDGEPASVHDLAMIDRSTSLSVLLSVFRDKKTPERAIRRVEPAELPTSHLNVAVELAGLLNAFVAEQTLERLRHHGPRIEDDDIRIAKTCLRQARDVVTSTIEVYFYVAKTDAMVPASAPAGSEVEVELGFQMLMQELRSNEIVPLLAFGSGGFVAVEIEQGTETLAYWCFVNLRKTRSIITVEVYHPKGRQMGSDVLSTVNDFISACCHRVNQVLLLQRLHQNRVASALLIPPDSDASEGSGSSQEELSTFRSGSFGCPVVFRTTFDLFHRCATNPTQVARTIEVTVLHIFAISNRGRFFVYKDESGSIFYMNLEPRGGGVESDGTIELVVYGVDEPGPSVTMQLTALLRKRLLQIAVDMLSAVLTKNSHYLWRRADIEFVQSFEGAWTTLDDGKADTVTPSDLVYEFPVECYDPAMLLLYFRQNLCGSTFFHMLRSGEWKAESEGVCREGLENALRLDGLNFVFFYNNAPSKLDQKFQGHSTLSVKGEEFSRQTGFGIAIIELELLDSDGSTMTAVPLRRPDVITSPLASPASLSMAIATTDAALPDSERRHRVRVRITDTALKRDVLHDWVLLTLNQTVVGWVTERHLESIQTGSWPASERPEASSPFESESSRNAVIESICPGLPILSSFLNRAYSLPHPIISWVEMDGVVRSSMVASVALDLLERTILDQLSIESRGKWSVRRSSGLWVVRLSRSERPVRVDLRWDSSKVQVFDMSQANDRQGRLQDAPIDCPEYLCFYTSQEYQRDDLLGDASPPKLFEEVAISYGGDEATEMVRTLRAVSDVYPTLFRRSFAFVFSVKRNRRTLLTYNWTSQAFKSTVARLRERNSFYLAATEQSMNSLEKLCLRELSPKISFPALNPPKPTTSRGHSRHGSRSDGSVLSGISEATAAEESQLETGSRHRVARPANIRRPKLIGKSVEGSAVHAGVAARARASSKWFKGGGPASSNAATKKAPPDDASRPPLGRRPSAEQQTKAESIASSKDEKELKRVQREYLSAIVTGRGLLSRLHGLQQRAFLAFSISILPGLTGTPIPFVLASFLLSNSSMAWSDVTELLPLPRRLLSSFLLSFGHTLSSWDPSLRLLPLISLNDAGPQEDCLILASEVKSVRNAKCVALAHISILTRKVKRKRKMFLRCTTWMATLPRHPSKQSQAGWSRVKYNNLCLFEKDSAGHGKLAAIMLGAVPLERMVFDYTAAMAERTMKLVEERLDFDEVTGLVRQLLARYPLDYQIRTLRSHYKIYTTNLVLSSYSDELIDMFDGPLLFKCLAAQASERKLIACSQNTLCFKREIIARGTHSIVFLTSERATPEMMQVLLLCRTQGRDITEYTFRDGSNIAIAIMNAIAIEAAGLAYEQLRGAAVQLHLDNLWKRASDTRTSSSFPSRAEINELLSLSTVKPLAEVVAGAEVQLLSMLFDESTGTDWRACCTLLGADPAFSPSWNLSEASNELSAIFYMKKEDVFLLLSTEPSGRGLQAAIVERNESPDLEERRISVAQMLLNYMGHFLWRELT